MIERKERESWKEGEVGLLHTLTTAHEWNEMKIKVPEQEIIKFSD